jgi:hypothetical protein
MVLRASYPPETKRGTLVHELAPGSKRQSVRESLRLRRIPSVEPDAANER